MTSQLVVQVVPNAFSQAEDATKNTLLAQSQVKNTIRRPTNGLVLREDTFATLRVVTGDGTNTLIVDGGSNRFNDDGSPATLIGPDGKPLRANDVYSNFLLQGIQEERSEKAQILETFGEPYIFLFGERPRMITFSGILINSQDFNWEAEWWYNYDNYLRGTRCVENDTRVFLSFDNTLISGYILSSSAGKNAQDKHHVSFNFQMFLTSYTTLTDIGSDSAAPTNTSELDFSSNILNANSNSDGPTRPVLLPDRDTLNEALATTSINSSFGSSFMTAVQNEQSVIDSTVSSFESIVRMGSTAISNILNGTVVRIPIGFAGSMAFNDNSTQVFITDDNIHDVVTYTVYSDNAYEYIGRSSHYGSSVSPTGIKQYNFEGTINDLDAGYAQVAAAKKIWEKAGFSVTTPDVVNLLAGANLLKTGLSIVNNVSLTAGLVDSIGGGPGPKFTQLTGSKNTVGGTITHSPTPPKVD